MKAMNSVGQKAINGQTLMKVLSVKPVLNRYVINLLGWSDYYSFILS